MTVQCTDLFHCLICGRVVFHPHGADAPICCAQPMVRAVADLVKDASQNQRTEAERQLEVEQHALLAETSEIANWCRSLKDTGVAPYEELAGRLNALRDALCDQFELEEREGDLAKILALDARFREGVLRLRDDHQQLLSLVDRFLRDLRQAELSLDWPAVCRRLDSLADEFRQHESAEGELVHLAAHADSKR